MSCTHTEKYTPLYPLYIKNMRERSEQEFNRVYTEAKSLVRNSMGKILSCVNPELSRAKYIVAMFRQPAQKSTIGSHSTMSFFHMSFLSCRKDLLLIQYMALGSYICCQANAAAVSLKLLFQGFSSSS